MFDKHATAIIPVLFMLVCLFAYYIYIHIYIYMYVCIYIYIYMSFLLCSAKECIVYASPQIYICAYLCRLSLTEFNEIKTTATCKRIEGCRLSTVLLRQFTTGKPLKTWNWPSVILQMAGRISQASYMPCASTFQLRCPALHSVYNRVVFCTAIIRLYTYKNTCTNKYLHIYIYICTHTHTHTYTTCAVCSQRALL